jgi:trans-aconitate 2-methyltransferase
MTEWNASGYASISQLQQAIATEQLSRVTLGETDRVLDIGCGNGKITVAIAARIPNGSVLGVDASQNMIDYAQQHYAAPNLQFQLEDARTLPFQNEFDQIVSFNAIHWISQQDTVLHGIYTALKPGGKGLLRFVSEGPRKCIENVVEEVCQLPQWNHYFKLHRKPYSYSHPTPEEHRVLAKQSGLKVLRLHVEDKSWDFQTRQGFLEYCQVTLVEWTRFLPEQERAVFIADVLDRYQQVAADSSSENNTFKFYQMEVVLTKPGQEL